VRRGFFNNVPEVPMFSANNWRLLPIIVVLFCCGCESKLKGKIEGTKWSSVAGVIKGKQIPAGGLRLDFGADGRLVYVVGFEQLTGRYSLGMGDNVTLTFDQEVSGRKTHVQKIFINGGKLTMRDSDGTELAFDPVK
jgi:hypothetical protein